MEDWETVVRRHSGIVWQTAWRLLGDRQDAADCFQETFLEALTLSRRQPVRSWPALLVRLCTFRALDRLRHRIRVRNSECELSDWASVASGGAGPVASAEAAELTARLRHALALLPPRSAAVFCLHALDGQSYREIAAQFGMRESAVGVLLHRVRARLREMLSAALAAEDVEVP